jgi:nicotinic acid mononucleotide adenylyltransferase
LRHVAGARLDRPGGGEAVVGLSRLREHRIALRVVPVAAGVLRLLPVGNGNNYSRKELVPFALRAKMLELLTGPLDGNIVISDYELSHREFLGSVQMLRDMGHPLFAIGADSLETIKTWINYETLIRENTFLIFPRSRINCQKLIEDDELLRQYENHFILVKDFEEMPISSAGFRKEKKQHMLTEEVRKYIENNGLYEVN